MTNQMAMNAPGHTRIPDIIRRMAEVSGIGFSGERPWDIKINDHMFYDSVMRDGSLGLGETYMLGHWDCDRLDEFFTRVLRVDLDKQILSLTPFKSLMEYLRHKLTNLQSISRSNQVALAHYDVGADVFRAMLDPTMSYSCGYWANARTLDEAQIAKLDLVCRKLELKAGDRLLDIGCGWGGLAAYAAERYGAQVTGVTVSREQYAYAQHRYAHLPVNFLLMDYRCLDGEFDKIASVGMFEHVGQKNYRHFLDKINALLEPDGLALLHTIGTHESVRHTDTWIDRYIFPNGRIPTAREIMNVLSDDFIIEDWHNFGQDYDRTLMIWSERFDAAWPGLSSKYDERFYRMWHYYLMSCAAFFRSRQGQLWQLVLSKRERSCGYRSVR
ncbi:MAG: cyclopropane fatty acyl phospholipid synthase [Rhodocyclaceae bacterium]|nr:cyclopropane fatty acyl phospholipid synthase [Rhodocyclaceae bacterium]